MTLSSYVKKIFTQRQLDINDLVIPVSGMWALLANDLHKSPSNASIVHKAHEEYEMLPEKLKSEVSGEDIAERLTHASNIHELQTRFETNVSLKEPWLSNCSCEIC